MSDICLLCRLKTFMASHPICRLFTWNTHRYIYTKWLDFPLACIQCFTFIFPCRPYFQGFLFESKILLQNIFQRQYWIEMILQEFDYIEINFNPSLYCIHSRKVWNRERLEINFLSIILQFAVSSCFACKRQIICFNESIFQEHRSSKGNKYKKEKCKTAIMKLYKSQSSTHKIKCQ